MRDFSGKVAVVTGAASGIGRALARRAAEEGMRVVLADIDEPALGETERELTGERASILAVPTDVSRAESVRRLAREALGAFGAVHLLFNNAGVAAPTCMWQKAWETSLIEWEWTMGVNLRGVIHGLRTFVPIMLRQDADSHIVNTASIGGFISAHGGAVYRVTKHAVVSLSETLYHDLAERRARIGVSVLCPGFTRTSLIEAPRNLPPELRDGCGSEPPNAEAAARFEAWKQAVGNGADPREVADHAFRAIAEGAFYILTAPEMRPMVDLRLEDIRKGRNPTDATAGTGL